MACRTRIFGEGVTAVVVPVKGAELSERPSSRRSKGGSPNSSSRSACWWGGTARNTMGKVQKNVLRDTYRDLYKAS